SENNGSIKLWELASGSMLHHLEGNSSPVLSLAFSPDGGRLASGGSTGLVHLWDTTTGHEQRIFREQLGPVLSQAFQSDASALITASTSGFHKWMLKEQDGTDVQGPSPGELFTSAAVSPDGEHVAFGTETG